MRRRLSPVDYDNIYTYIETNGYGSNVKVAETYGVSPNHVGLIVSTYMSIMNNTPLTNKNAEKLTHLIRAAKEYKSRTTDELYAPCKTTNEHVDSPFYNPSAKKSFRENLLDLAITKEAINLFVTNTQARNAFYDLLNSLS